MRCRCGWQPMQTPWCLAGAGREQSAMTEPGAEEGSPTGVSTARCRRHGRLPRARARPGPAGLILAGFLDSLKAWLLLYTLLRHGVDPPASLAFAVGSRPDDHSSRPGSTVSSPPAAHHYQPSIVDRAETSSRSQQTRRCSARRCRSGRKGDGEHKQHDGNRQSLREDLGEQIRASLGKADLTALHDDLAAHNLSRIRPNGRRPGSESPVTDRAIGTRWPMTGRVDRSRCGQADPRRVRR